jgi:phosphonate transport system ATP-binding protein
VLCNLHQVDYAREFADRIVGLAQGRVVFDGAPQAMGPDDIDRIYMPPPAAGRNDAAGPPALLVPLVAGTRA